MRGGEDAPGELRWILATGRAMDDELVKRVLLHLNENHERDYMVSQDYEHEQQFEREPEAQVFDAEGFEAAKKEGRKAWLGEYARQQELLLELKVEQTKAEAALEVTSAAVDRAAASA